MLQKWQKWRKIKLTDALVDELVEKYDGIFTPEECIYLANRWRRMVKFNSIDLWREDVNSFVLFACYSGYKLGDVISRPDKNAPFSPQNCEFRSGVNTDFVKKWDKCVYNYNRNRVEIYKKTRCGK